MIAGPETLARLGGRCKLCTKRIRAGVDYVAKLEAIGWVHASCAASHRQLLAEHAEDAA